MNAPIPSSLDLQEFAALMVLGIIPVGAMWAAEGPVYAAAVLVIYTAAVALTLPAREAPAFRRGEG